MVCLAGTHTVRGLVRLGNTGVSFDTFNGQRCAFFAVGNLWLALCDANGYHLSRSCNVISMRRCTVSVH